MPGRNDRNKPDAVEARAREMAIAAGIDPDSRVAKVGDGSGRGMPAWCGFREMVRAERREQAAAQQAVLFANAKPQPAEYQNTPIRVFGNHEQNTLDQMRNCARVGNVAAAALMADGHKGYAMPVGGVMALDGQVSISGVGFDIGCGNRASRLDIKIEAIVHRLDTILRDITSNISFGVGRKAKHRVHHDLFDDAEAWRKAGMESYRAKAIDQFTTVGGGNHYIDLLVDEAGYVWIGNHFGSRGTGHTVASEHMKLNGGRDGMDVPPAIVDEESELGQRYIAAMQLGGRIASDGRTAVNDIIAQRIIGAHIVETVANHHNYAWKEKHIVNGTERDLWVVRKGATPSRPGQLSFVGGSMGDDAVIIRGMDTEEARATLYSTVHGAGRVFGRKEALRRFTHEEWRNWMKAKGVLVSGGDLDESPMAYRRLPDVLAHHAGSVQVVHTLRPVAVAMAGKGEVDPWKD